MQSFGFTGYQMDSAGGLYFAQARRYDAGTGRFVSEDFFRGTATAPYTLNHYSYCWNRPLDLVDLNGMIPTAGVTRELANMEESCNSGNISLKEKQEESNGLGFEYESYGDEGNYYGYINNSLGITSTTSKISKGLDWAGYAGDIVGLGFDIYDDVTENIDSGAKWEEYVADIGVDVGAVAGLVYYTVTEVITINGKSLKDWAKTGLNWLLEEIFETHNCVSTA